MEVVLPLLHLVQRWKGLQPRLPLAEPPVRHRLAEDRTRLLFRQHSPDTEWIASPRGLRMRARGRDPFVYGPPIAIDLKTARLVRVTVDFLGLRGHALKVYFISDRMPVWCEEQSLEAAAPDVDGPVPLLFDFSENDRWVGTEVKLRIDLERMRRHVADTAESAEVELHEVELLAGPGSLTDFVLPPLLTPGEEFPLVLALRGGLGEIPRVSTTLDVTDRPHDDRFRQAGPVCFKLRAAEPGLHEITLGSLTADIWVPEPVEHVILRHVRISPEVAIITDGHGLRRTSIPLTRSTAADGGIALEGSRRIEGVEVRARLAVGPVAEPATPWTLTITPSAPLAVLDVASPVFVLGPGSGRGPSLAVLPGIEMRTAGLPQALLPEPSLLTWRAAYMEEDGTAVAVTWDHPQATPRFAAPGLLSALSLHMPPRPDSRGLAPAAMVLDEPLTLNGLIVVTPSRSTLAAVAGAIAPAPPSFDAAEVLARAVEALDGPFRGPRGLTLPHVGAASEEEYFDPRSCLSLLAGGRTASARAQVDRYLASPAAAVPLGVGLLFPECLDRAVATLASQSRDLAARVRSDGTWPPQLPPGCHAPDPRPFSLSASAIAQPAALLLWAAACGLCDTALVETSLDRLRAPEMLPTGGQGWEFAPDVPELLGAAHAAEAFLLAHELGLDPAGLDRAADWLLLGLTFFHLDPNARDPRHPFACCPALGVTRSPAGGLLWYTHAPENQLDWRGLSCPWIGLRFADTLERFLAASRRHRRHRRHGLDDALNVMAKVSRGSLAHALTLLRPDGSLIDGLVIRTGVETEPLYRAPLDVAWHALRMLSACPDPIVARHGCLTVIGAGTFAVDGEALLFNAALPRSQAILVTGPGEVRQNGHEMPLRQILPGIHGSEIDGRSTASIQPR